MKDLSLGDWTQRQVLAELATTETLLSRASAMASERRERAAEIIALPDLGVARSVRRMHGGFFNGALYQWHGSGFVPVDATVNSCGVSLFRLGSALASEDEFFDRVERARHRVDGSPYVWNLDTSNHFVAYGEIVGSTGLIEDGPFALLHSSAAEHKRQHLGLYPTHDNWFAEHVREATDEATGRTLRFIHGQVAETFIDLAQHLERHNRIRHRLFAQEIFGAEIRPEEVLYRPHYGMPTRSSVAVGCQWVGPGEVYAFLTTSDEPMYLIQAKDGGRNRVELDGRQVLVVPHGVGNVLAERTSLRIEPDGLRIGDALFGVEDSLRFGREIELRGFGSSPPPSSRRILRDVLEVCHGEIVAELHQVYNYNRDTAG